MAISSSEIVELDSNYLIQSFPARDGIVVGKMRGTKIIDVEGREYLDLFSGIAVNNVGHCHPKVVEAVKEQVETFMHVSAFYYSEPMARLAEKLASIARVT